VKPRSSRSDGDQIVRKITVLRAYLARYNEITTVNPFNVDSSFDRDGVRGDGSRLGQVVSWLKPEILMCTSRGDTKPEFLVLPDGKCIDATSEALETWLQEQKRQTVSEDIGKALRVLQSAGSRLSSRSGQSEAAKAVNTLRKLLVIDEAKPAA
jgi:hypothetical protein